MDAIDKLLSVAEHQWGVPGRRVIAASLPISALVSYFIIFEALHGMDLFGALWAHAITLCLIAVTAWVLFAPRLLAAIDRRQSAIIWSFTAVALGLIVAASTEPSRVLRDRLVIAALLALVVFLKPGPASTATAIAAPVGHGARLVPWAAWMPRLAAAARRKAAWLSQPARIVAGTGLLALLTLSLPESVTWMKTPSPTADDKIGVWVAEFEGDEAHDTQRSLMTTIEAVAFEDPALAQLVEIKALPWVIALEGPRAEQDRAAEEARAAVKASLLIFGTYSKAQANVYTAVAPEYTAFSPFFLIPTFPELRIDRSDQVGAVYAVAKYITGIIYLFDNSDCTNAERQFQAALDRVENDALLKDIVLFDDIRVAIAQSVTCEASHGLADSERLRQSIATLERIIGSATTPAGDAPPTGDLAQRRAMVELKAWGALGYAYRMLSQLKGEPVAVDLGHTIVSYRQGLAALSRLPWSKPLSMEPLLELQIRSNLGVAYEKLAYYSGQVTDLIRAVAEYDRANALSLCKEAAASHDVARGCASLQNNLGVALQRLAESGVQPVVNLKRAANAYTSATARLSKTAPEERSFYALNRSNLADSYQLLAAYEERNVNLQQARQAIEDSLTVIRTIDDPNTFAEIMYKFGQIETAEAADTHDESKERAGLADWACSLFVFNRLSQYRAGVVAHALNAVRKRVGDAAFVQRLSVHTPAAECPYAPADIPRLIAAYEG
jgi:hypothetical protein